MDTYTGYVQYLKIVDDGSVFVTVGLSTDEAQFLAIVFDSRDTAAQCAIKRAFIGLLVRACSFGFQVEAHTAGGSSIISYLGAGPFEVSPNDQPVHEDFFAVTGQNFPNDAELVFDSDSATVTVTPDFVRPHLLLVSSLPASIPVGWNTVAVSSSAGISEPFPVYVSDEPRYVKRVFNSGAAKQYPFTLAIVANGSIDRDGTLDLYADPILGNRSGYHAIVDYAMNNIFAVAEDFLRPDDRDAEMRIVSIFDDSLDETEANTLCEENPDSTLMAAVKERVNPFLSSYGEVTDLCIAFHGSTTNERGSASRCADDYTRGAPEVFTYDDVEYSHWPYRDDPGSAAISVNNSTNRMTAIHELGHAASEDDNGRVRDLYNDNASATFTVNKKWRDAAKDPIPPIFSTYNGVEYDSDANRDSLGYEADWVSYHCELQDDTVPNLMDTYASTSRLDKVTYAWYKDRIRVILDR